METLMLVLLLIGGALSKNVDTCPKVKTQPSFKVDQYIGRWYQASQLNESTEKCLTYDVKSKNSTHIKCLIRSTDKKTGINLKKQWLAEVKTSEAKITFVQASFPLKSMQFFWVLDTDYTSYAVLWSCDNNNDSKKYAWILTRTQHPPENLVDKASQTLSQYGITKDMLKKTDQTNCPNFADIQ